VSEDRRTIDFFRESASSEGRHESKENGPDVSLDWAISRVEIGMMRTLGGHSRRALPLLTQLSRDHRKPPVNALGYIRVMFAVTDKTGRLKGSARAARPLVGDCKGSIKTRIGLLTSVG